MKKFAAILLTAITAFNVVAVVPVSALLEGSKDAVCKGLALSESANCSPAAGNASRVNNLVSTALNLFSAIIGIIAVVMIMISGIKYTTSQGDAGQVNSAKNTALYAAIGLVIAAISQILVRFILTRFD